MAKEPDQTKWVGIRPTDPSENIPVTESNPLTNILVAPSAGDPQFQTRTRKFAPAISDLQAIKGNYDYFTSYDNQDCSGVLTKWYGTVGADEIWVITNICAVNLDSICDMILGLFSPAGARDVKAFYTVPAGNRVTWGGQLFLTNGFRIHSRWEAGGLTDDLKIWIHGYKIGVY